MARILTEAQTFTFEMVHFVLNLFFFPFVEKNEMLSIWSATFYEKKNGEQQQNLFHFAFIQFMLYVASTAVDCDSIALKKIVGESEKTCCVCEPNAMQCDAMQRRVAKSG